MSSNVADVPATTDIPASAALPVQEVGVYQTSMSMFMFMRSLKRTTDVVLAIVALVFLLPLLSLITVSIKLTSRGPVIFRQLRIGRCGQSYEIYKFRTMTNGAPLLLKHEVRAGAADKHITWIGGILRRLSLDELPQLVNVLRGDMSLVGPRPATHAQTERTGLRMQQSIILQFRPGMTGWAQIKGRGDLDDAETVALDLEYCRDWTWWLDWRILLATFRVVVSKRGAY